MDNKRQTGRTTRMLEHAKALAKAGRAVYIIAANEQQRRWLEDRIGQGPMGIKVETWETLRNFDWQTMSLLGAHPNCAVVVDHFAIESRFRRMLEELVRYDVPSGVGDGSAVPLAPKRK